MRKPPNAQETLLLRASLERGPSAIAAWQAWRAATDFDNLAGEAHRIVPLLYRNLARNKVPAEETVRYASVYRHTWAANRLAFKACARALTLLHAAGIETLLLKGAAMTLLHYRDSGVRSMTDVDVLIPPARAIEAVEILRANGWQGTPLEARRLDTRYSKDYRDAYGHGIDLHWYACADARHPGADAPFWEASVPALFEGVPTRALGPTDLLYNVLAHAWSSNARHVRWAADAATLIGATPIDWQRLVAIAEARRLVLPLHAQLGWLRGALGVPVPEAALAALAQAKVTWLDRLEHDNHVSKQRYRADRVMVRLWCWYRRTTDARGLELALGFPGWLARYYEAVRASGARPASRAPRA